MLFEKNLSATEIKHWNRYLFLAFSGIPYQIRVAKLGQNAYAYGWPGQDAYGRPFAPSVGVWTSITWKKCIQSVSSRSCGHTGIGTADQTRYLAQSEYTDTGSTSLSTDPLTTGGWQCSH